MYMYHILILHTLWVFKKKNEQELTCFFDFINALKFLLACISGNDHERPLCVHDETAHRVAVLYNKIQENVNIPLCGKVSWTFEFKTDFSVQSSH